MPARPRRYYVYILSNRARTVLYVGVTNDLGRRMEEPRSGENPALADQSSVLACL